MNEKSKPTPLNSCTMFHTLTRSLSLLTSRQSRTTYRRWPRTIPIIRSSCFQHNWPPRLATASCRTVSLAVHGYACLSPAAAAAAAAIARGGAVLLLAVVVHDRAVRKHIKDHVLGNVFAARRTPRLARHLDAAVLGVHETHVGLPRGRASAIEGREQRMET